MNESTRRQYVEMFAKNGIPAERVTMMPRTPDKKEHLDIYNQVDIGLDPFPYNGATTSCEALWMGVPVISLCGDRHRARVTSSILTRIGLAELIAETETDYISKAVQLAGDTNRISGLRASLRARMQQSPLCDADAFARSVENAYQEIWRKWCFQEKTVPEFKALNLDFPASSPEFVSPTPEFRAPTALEFKTPEREFEAPAAKLEAPAAEFQIPTSGIPQPAPGIQHLGFNIDQELRTAVQLHQSGQFDKASEIYNKVLTVNPNHADALHLLGVTKHQAGQHEVAVDIIRKAISVNPRNAFYYNNMGIALKEQGKSEEAILAYRAAVEISPDYMEGHINMAMALKEQGKRDELIECYRNILRIRPDYAEVYNTMGIALKSKGELDQAIDCYLKVLEIRPDYVEAHINMGNALKMKGEKEEAISCYQKALEIKPDYAEAYNNMGAVLEDQGKQDEAVACYRKALEFRPDYAEASHNTGNVLKKEGKLEEAIEYYRKAVEISPAYAEAYNSLGIALKENGKIDEAIECYRKALEIEPKGTGAYYNMGNALGEQGKADESVKCYQKALEFKPEYAEAYVNMGNVLKNQGKIDESIESYRKAMEYKPEYHQAHSNFLFTLHYKHGYSLDWMYEEHCRWDEIYGKPLAEKILPHTNDAEPDRKLRVGYVSPDFRSHSCAYFIDPLFRGHDKNQVEIFCYSEVPKPDDVTKRIEDISDHWYKTVGKSDEEVANQIREDRIDILVDVAGHTANNRLLVFAQKPAPIQVTWLGYPDTTGMSAIDYRLTDALADPEGDSDKYVRESPKRLSEGFLCYSPLYTTPDVGELQR